MIGRTISHYQILEKLGEGGMGVVYKARDSHLDRFVAIKVLPPERVADPERKLRFVQEAKAASALNHPNIVHIYDIDQHDGIDYIAMEYVAGKTLTDLISRKGMGLNETLRCAVQIADALTAAHEAGIIHRDVKPGNVMVTDKGLVKVLDFGLAKLTEQAPPGPDESTRTLKPTTEEGTILGTVAYMSPEQAEGKAVNARSDIFSFGAVLYEMVTGQRAFQKDSKASTLAAILTQEPGPLPPVVPHDLEKITRALPAQGPSAPLPAHGRRQSRPRGTEGGLGIGQAKHTGWCCAPAAKKTMDLGGGRGCCCAARRRRVVLPPAEACRAATRGAHAAHLGPRTHYRSRALARRHAGSLCFGPRQRGQPGYLDPASGNRRPAPPDAE